MSKEGGITRVVRAEAFRQLIEEEETVLGGASRGSPTATSTCLCQAVRSITGTTPDEGTRPCSGGDECRQYALGPGDEPWISFRQHDYLGLALSGGGIRSSTFALGVLQALQRANLLARVRYLSTVSGGGYVAGFWTRHRIRFSSDEGSVEPPFVDSSGARDTDSAGPQVMSDTEGTRHLRHFGRFLAPRYGLASADTWQFAVAWVRGLMVTLPVGLALVCGSLSIAMLLAEPPQAITEIVDGLELLPRLAVYCAPLLLVVFIVPETLWRSRDIQRKESHRRITFLVTAVLSAGITTLISANVPRKQFEALLASINSGETCEAAVSAPISDCMVRVTDSAIDALRPMTSFGDWALTLLLSCGTAACLILLSTGVLRSLSDTAGGHATTLAFGGFIDAFERNAGRLLATAVMLAVAVGAAFLTAATSLSGPASLIKLIIGTTSGALVPVLLRHKLNQAWTPATTPRMRATSVSIPIAASYAALMLVASAVLTQLALAATSDRSSDMVTNIWTALGGKSGAHDNLRGSPEVYVVAALLSGLVALSGLYLVSPNESSMHAFYRARISRAFLGAALADWRRTTDVSGPHHSDEQHRDDVHLHGHEQRLKGAPLHLINCTANNLAADTLGDLERGGRAATISTTGIAIGGVRRSMHSIYLGAALAASGAALNSQMGAYSRRLGPAVSFLMTMLNIRLGMWIRVGWGEGRTERQSSARLAAEFFNQTSAPLSGTADVHLSDGGHFENTGLYELVRRHMRYIILVDTGQDATTVGADLARAIRRVREDFGVEIDIDLHPFEAPAATGVDRSVRLSAAHVAVGTIHYDRMYDVGTLVVLKPTLTGDEPLDVLAYAKLNSQFPHQSTADQFFDSAQWEAYRRLGTHVGATVLGAVGLTAEEAK